MSLYSELKDRKVIRVAAIYLVVAWLIVQVVVAVSGPLLLPDWFARGVILVLTIGFPFALIISWAFEATPAEASGKGKPLAIGLIAATAVVMGFILTGFNSSDSVQSGPEALVATEVQQQSLPIAEVVDDVQQRLPNSVAVLPFENLSADPENAFFAAGIHEEVLNQLVKLSALNVIARTTMSRYANTDKTIAQVAEELNVETVMEGSVRYANDRVLVTVQLIDPNTESHLWSESYNRDFSDIFAIQADIAMNIANALKAEFSAEEQARIEEIPTNSPAAYALYLRSLGDNAGLLRGAETIRQILVDLDHAIELDPEFALAYAERARQTLSLALTLLPNERGSSYAISREFAEKALELNPELSEAYEIQGDIHTLNWQFLEALAAYDRAYELGGGSNSAIQGTLLILLGDTERRDRVSAGNYHLAGFRYLVAGNFDAAEKSFLENLKRFPLAANSLLELGRIESRRKNYGKALEYLKLVEGLGNNNSIRGGAVLAYSYGLAGSPADAARHLNRLKAVSSEQYIDPLSWALAYLGSGDQDQALSFLREVADNKDENPPQVEMAVLKLNLYDDPVLEQPEFVEVRRRLGIED